MQVMPWRTRISTGSSRCMMWSSTTTRKSATGRKICTAPGHAGTASEYPPGHLGELHQGQPACRQGSLQKGLDDGAGRSTSSGGHESGIPVKPAVLVET